jgi:hypothetical protein
VKCLHCVPERTSRKPPGWTQEFLTGCQCCCPVQGKSGSVFSPFSSVNSRLGSSPFPVSCAHLSGKLHISSRSFSLVHQPTHYTQGAAVQKKNLIGTQRPSTVCLSLEQPILLTEFCSHSMIGEEMRLKGRGPSKAEHCRNLRGTW